MSETATQLREKLDRLGRAKQASAAEDLLVHMARSPGERLAAALAHCDAHIAAFGDQEFTDDAAERWVRTRRRLPRLG